jgi:Polyketide cyclase / dehydrase and lipid transport
MPHGERVSYRGVKELRGNATGSLAVPIEDCFALLAAVDGYPTWYPEVVREVQVVEHDGENRPTKARVTLHLSHGPLVRDFRLLLAIQAERPSMVRLARLSNDPSDHEQFEVTWRLQHNADTRIELELDANLSVPRFLPLGGIGDALAEGFVRAATKALDSPRR